MEAIALAVTLTLAAAAEGSAPSIAGAPRAATLLALQAPQEEPPADPPLVDAPDTPPNRTPLPPSGEPEPPQSNRWRRPTVQPGDPYSNSASPSEVGVGIIGVLGGDLATFATIAVVGVLFSASAPIVLAILSVAAVLVLPPLGAAVAVWGITDKNLPNNGFKSAFWGAAIAHVIGIGTVVGLSFFLGGQTSGPASAVVGLLGLGLHLVGVPLGSSMGLHRGTLPATELYGALPQPSGPRASGLATRPHEFHRAAKPMLSPSLVRFAF